MQRPGYYNTFLARLEKDNTDDFPFFMNYLTSLGESDWHDFFSDLFNNRPYPALIQKVRKDYSTIAYYTIFFKRLNEDVRIIQDRVINKIFNEYLNTNLAVRKDEFMVNMATYCRLMERGVRSKLLIDKVILNKKIAEAVKFEAAITLVFYKDIVTLNFWRYRSEELLPNSEFRYLAFPRFCFLSKIEPLAAFQSLQHFSLGQFVSEQEMLLPLEDFFMKYVDADTSRPELRAAFEKLDKPVREFILNKVLVGDQMKDFKELFETPLETGALANLEDFNIEFKSLNKQILDVKVTNQDISYMKLLKSIEGKIDPYNAFTVQEISAIDPGFLRKTSIFNHINSGIKCFKESKFNPALENYEKALEIIRDTKEKDNLTVYFYSWILHEVGNICLVNNRLDLAKNYYTNSYIIKSGIEEIPKTFLFATQLKLYSIFLEEDFKDIDLLNNFNIFIGKLKKYKKTSNRNAHYFIDCLLGDSYYYLTKAQYYNNNEKAFDRYFTTSLRYAINNDDFAGKLKLYALHSLAKKSDRYFEDIITLLDITGKRKLRNPYLSSLVNIVLLGQSSVSEMGSRLFNLFKKFVHTPQVTKAELDKIRQAEAVFIKKGI